jgi:hypothetical protein
MHLNRKKIKQNKLKISPRGGKKKKIKIADPKPVVRPVKRSKKKNKQLRISKTSGLNSIDIKNFGDKSLYKPIREWKSLLEGQAAFILGNAPSITRQNLDILNPYFTIGVNRILYIFTPTILIWQDIQMWNSEKKKIANNKSLKICNSVSDPRKAFLNFKVKGGNFKFGNDPSILHGTGNTTALAAQLAVNLGCSDIILLGTDCQYQSGKTDFYGKNKDHKSYTLKMCNVAMEWMRDNCPIPVHNCSKNKLWPEENIVDVIKKLGPKKLNRKEYIRKFKR